MDPLMLMGALFIGWPALALLPAGLFLGLGLWTRSRLAHGAAALWLAYAGYEALMKARILCSGECNIRIDLLVLYPVLLLVSALALVAAATKRRRASK